MTRRAVVTCVLPAVAYALLLLGSCQAEDDAEHCKKCSADALCVIDCGLCEDRKFVEAECVAVRPTPCVDAGQNACNTQACIEQTGYVASGIFDRCSFDDDGTLMVAYCD